MKRLSYILCAVLLLIAYMPLVSTTQETIVFAQTTKAGDVNQDDCITLFDVISIVRHINGETPLTGTQKSAADIDKSGSVQLSDAMALFRHINGKDTLNGINESALPHASNQTVTATVGTLSCTNAIPKGTSLSVPITLSNLTALNGIDLRIAYNSSLLRFESHDNPLADHWMLQSCNTTPVSPSLSSPLRELWITAVSYDPFAVSDKDVLFTLYFTAVADITSDTAINMIHAAVCQNNTEYTVKNVDGGIELQESTITTTTTSVETTTTTTTTTVSKPYCTLTVGTITSTKTIEADDTISIPIKTSDMEQLSFQMRLAYDSALLTYIGFDAPRQTDFSVFDVSDTPHEEYITHPLPVKELWIAAIALEPLTFTNGETVITLHFKVNTAISTDTTIELFYNTIIDPDNQEGYATAIDGGIKITEPTVGVNEINGEYYYINKDGSYKIGTFWVTAVGANGYISAGNVYTDETGRFYHNEFLQIDDILYYMEKGQPTSNTGVREINGNLYSINHKGQVNIGEIWVTQAGSNGLVTEGYCYTDETGRFYHNEFATLPDGTRYYMVKGRPFKGEGGVCEANGDLYYVSWKGTVLTGTVYVSNPNGYTVKGNHYTDETGRFYHNEFVTLEDGNLYYMVKGRPMQNGGGVEKIDNNLYYITWKGTVLIGKIYVTNPNGYTVKGKHYTDETGRFYNEEFVTMNEKIYYIVNGRIYNAPGVIEVNKELYYVTWEGPLATDEVYVTYTNGLVPSTGFYYTDETGRFLDGEFTKAGDGKTYYIVNGAKYETKGVLKIDGNYYYVSWNNSIVVNGPVNITTANSNGYDIPVGKFTTDENGIILF